MRVALTATVVLALSVFVASCGPSKGGIVGPIGGVTGVSTPQTTSSSSSGTGSSTSSSSGGGNLNLSGRITFDRVPTSANGLNFSAVAIAPSRGCTVQLSVGSTTIAKTSTDADGKYAFSGVVAKAAVRVTAVAQLGAPDAPDVTVVNNTASGTPVWGIYADYTLTADKTDANLHAKSGWGGSSYTTTRQAAAFAILDTVYKAQQLVRTAAPSITFPVLQLNWSPQNHSSDVNNPSTGELPSSYYSNGKIFIMGDATDDTDEFDEIVIAHEWGHYFTDKFSRDDSLGGAHAIPQILDEATAFSEGFASGQASIIIDSRYYTETSFQDGAGESWVLDLEADRYPANAIWAGDTRRVDGAWSECSIWQVVRDLMDGGTGDDDSLALGYKPIYDSMVGNGVKNAVGFTTMFSFLKAIKDANGGNASAIAALAAAENIGDHDEFELTAAAERRYTVIPGMDTEVTQDMRGVDLTCLIKYEQPSYTGYANNRLFSRLMFKVTVPTAGSHSITVTPLTAGAKLGICAPQPDGQWVAGTTTGQAFTVGMTTAAANELAIFSVGILLQQASDVKFKLKVNTAAAPPSTEVLSVDPISAPLILAPPSAEN